MVYDGLTVVCTWLRMADKLGTSGVWMDMDGLPKIADGCLWL